MKWIGECEQATLVTTRAVKQQHQDLQEIWKKTHEDLYQELQRLQITLIQDIQFQLNLLVETVEQNRIVHLCQGVDFSVKLFKTANRFKNPIKVALFTISCISFIFLIGIGSFCINFIKIYPLQRIDHLPPLRIHLLYKDCPVYPVQTRINSLCLFLLFLFTPPCSALSE